MQVRVFEAERFFFSLYPTGICAQSHWSFLHPLFFCGEKTETPGEAGCNGGAQKREIRIWNRAGWVPHRSVVTNLRASDATEPIFAPKKGPTSILLRELFILLRIHTVFRPLLIETEFFQERIIAWLAT